MATYFSTNLPGIQGADNMQTLYLMNPGLVGFQDAPAQGNIFTFGQHSGNQLPGNEQQFISIPMMAQPVPSMASSHPGDLSAGVAAGSNPRQHGFWRNNIPSEFSFVQSINQTSPTATNTSSFGNQQRIPGVPTDSSHQSVGEVLSQAGLRREQQGGLSLSLSSSPLQLMDSTNSLRSDAQASAAVLQPSAGGNGGEGTGEERAVKWEGGLQSVLMGSKYLRAAQQLLDEIVNVGRGLRSGQGDSKSAAKEAKAKKEPAVDEIGDVGSNQGNELSAAERQELQMKKAKLITMLEEVDQRYKQYRHQMQVVVSSFEAAAGAGAARAYTALALQTISKQFRCLRDAISGQIKLTNRILGEEDGLGGGKADGSRLTYIDHQLRQQRALQQLGMVQNNAWRPQRGLPERSVSVLRAWLFEHFLHPYPKDADKVMLAKQTGLTRSQVSNWFINARVRLWKPMVEEMYMEEVKEHENEGKEEEKASQSAEPNDDLVVMKPATTDSPLSASQGINTNTNNQNEEITTEKRTSPPSISTATTTMSSLGNLKNLTSLGLIVSPASSSDHHASSILDNDSLSQFTPKKMRNNGFHNLGPLPSVNTSTNITAESPNAAGFGSRQGYDLAAAVAAAAAAATENGGSYGSYQIGDIGRYSHESFAPRGNGVSLTLGLPHCDSLSLSGSQHPCLSSPNMAMGRSYDLGNEASNGFCSQNPSTAAAAAGHPGNAYESITMQGRKRFAAQLLPDFVS